MGLSNCLDLPEDYQVLRSIVRKFAEDRIRPQVLQNDREARFPAGIIEELGQLGFMGAPIDPQYGGSGSDFLSYAILIEELSRVDPSIGTIVSAHTSLTAVPLQRWGTEEQKGKYLSLLASGKTLGAFALTEPESGTDAASIQTRASRDGDHYFLTGTKVWITNANHAGLFIVFARTDNRGNHKDISAFIVDRESPGLVVDPSESKLGIKAAHSCTVHLDGVKVSARDRLGEEGQGFKIAMQSLDGGRIGIAAQAVGIGQACLEMSIQYAVQRRQFGRPIAEFQAIQWKIADMATQVEAARLLTYRAAMLEDKGENITLAASMAKLFASEMCVSAAREAIQIHGSLGYSAEYPVEKFYRDSKVTEIYEGTSEAQRMVIASRLLKELQ